MLKWHDYSANSLPSPYFFCHNFCWAVTVWQAKSDKALSNASYFDFNLSFRSTCSYISQVLKVSFAHRPKDADCRLSRMRISNSQDLSNRKNCVVTTKFTSCGAPSSFHFWSLHLMTDLIVPVCSHLVLTAVNCVKTSNKLDDNIYGFFCTLPSTREITAFSHRFMMSKSCTSLFLTSTSEIRDWAIISASKGWPKKSDTRLLEGFPPPWLKHSCRYLQKVE